MDRKHVDGCNHSVAVTPFRSRDLHRAQGKRPWTVYRSSDFFQDFVTDQECGVVELLRKSTRKDLPADNVQFPLNRGGIEVEGYADHRLTSKKWPGSDERARASWLRGKVSNLQQGNTMVSPGGARRNSHQSPPADKRLSTELMRDFKLAISLSRSKIFSINVWPESWLSSVGDPTVIVAL
ncbi:hypothetical protein GFL58_30930 [Rhizobium leguminosarum bv. viciae]|uniref:hypothetical protein n=1 Tax=Rhizobium leguminosarum TaxID=384 RepID=UPI00143F2E60|nr:hypothetical protein [Rhizobium leguminosarum]NKM65333.1 hypothetical protein [Rhizobium leguminosarum bv. viciae]